MRGDLELLLDALRCARHVVVLTGAGVSAESGIPTFRDRMAGLWEQFDPAELATPEAFQRDPALVWGWYEWRRMQVMKAQPNPAHVAIAELESRVPSVTLATQNVDDLHERSGSKGVIHLHGQIGVPYCERCKRPHELPATSPKVSEGGIRIEPPRCATCGSRIRPGVVWFGEELPQAAWHTARQASTDADVFFNVGTSSVVQPAASLLEIAAHAGAVIVQVNPNPTPLERVVTHSLQGPAGSVLPELLFQAWGPGSVKSGRRSEQAQNVLILRVGAEGGDISLYGRRDSDGHWCFRQTVKDQTPMPLDEQEDDAGTEKESIWVRSWSDAMRLLDRHPLVTLVPMKVDPEFRKQIWEEVDRRLAKQISTLTERSRERWRRVCAIEL